MVDHSNAITDFFAVLIEVAKKIGSLPFALIGMLPEWLKWLMLSIFLLISLFLIWKFITMGEDHFKYDIE